MQVKQTIKKERIDFEEGEEEVELYYRGNYIGKVEELARRTVNDFYRRMNPNLKEDPF